MNSIQLFKFFKKILLLIIGSRKVILICGMGWIGLSSVLTRAEPLRSLDLRWSDSLSDVFGEFFKEAWGFAPKKMGAQSEPLHPSVETVWVVRPDGAQSCAPQSGMSLTQGAFELKEANIPILESRKGNDGKLHAQYCGAQKGTTNVFRIPRKNLKEAIALGYHELGMANSGS